MEAERHWDYRFCRTRIGGIGRFFDVDGGFLAFTNETPIPDTRRVNMTLDFGPGLYIPVGPERWLKMGVQFFHFSNAHAVRLNPGFDTFFVYAAYTFRNIHPW